MTTIKCEGNSFLLYASPYVARHGWKTFAFPKPSHNDSNAKFRIRIGEVTEGVKAEGGCDIGDSGAIFDQLLQLLRELHFAV